MRIFTCLGVLTLFGFLLFGCQQDTSPADNNLTIDAVLSENSAFGWEVNDLIKSGKDISNLTQRSALIQTGYEDPFAVGKLKQTGEQLMLENSARLAEKYLTKPMDDSLYFYWNDTLNGTRSAIYYNAETGLGTYYTVKYKYAGWRPLVYDSSAAVVDLNFTLDNIADDRLLELYQQQLYKESFFIREITSVLQVTDYNGTEITGVQAVRDTYYQTDRFLQHLRQSAVVHPDQSGTLREDFEFRDNTTAFNSVTFYSDHSGEFSRQWRDGTTVSGTFNSIEDDQQGFYTELVDFPEGRYLDKILKSAVVTITMPQAIFSADLLEKIYFSSGRIDSIQVGLVSQQEGNIRVTSLEVLKANGAHGNFTLQQNEDESNLSGNWTTWNQYFILVTAEYYLDGSAHIHYEVFAPPYTEGDTPILVADYTISPDGSGSGTITYQDEIYEITFDGSSQAEIAKGDKKTSVHLFQ